MIEYSIYDNIVNESIQISSPEGAEAALNKIKDGNDRDMIDYIAFILKWCVTWAFTGLIGVLLFKCLTKWLSWPGSINDKQKRCDELIRAIDTRLNQLDDKKDRESVKAVSELKKVREKAVKEKSRLVDKSAVAGGYRSSTYKEQAVSIFDFDIV